MRHWAAAGKLIAIKRYRSGHACPVRQKGDDANSGLSAFIPSRFWTMGKRGIAKLHPTNPLDLADTADDGVC